MKILREYMAKPNKLKEFTDFAVARAKEILIEEGVHHPLFLISSNKTLYLYSPDFDDEKKKDESALLMKLLVNHLNADMVAFISESWMTLTAQNEGEDEKQHEKRARAIRSSQDENRIEALIVVGESPYDSCIAIEKMKRDDNEKLVGFESLQHPEKMNMKGRFAQFFEPIDPFDHYLQSLKPLIRDIAEKMKSDIVWN